MGKREAKVEQHLKKKVDELGGACYKWVSPGLTGVPDRIVLLRGQVYFCELKSTDGEPSSAQERRMKELRNHGFQVFLLKGIKEVDWFIEYLKKENRIRKC